MLPVRRLPLPQSPVSGWRITAVTSTANAVARRAPYSSSKTPDGIGPESSDLALEPQSQIKGHSLVKGENEPDAQHAQQRPKANSETNTKDSHALHFLAFRKYAIDGPVPLDALSIYENLPNRYRNLVASDEQALAQQMGKNERYNQQPESSSITHADLPKPPPMKGDSGNEWTEGWVKKIGKLLGLRISKRDIVNFKLSIGRKMGLKVNDRRLSSPATALAAIRDREMLSRKVLVAKDRQEELAMQGIVPPLLPRNRKSAGDQNFKANADKLRPSELEAQDKAPGLTASKQHSNAAQIGPGDLVGSNLRDSLRDTGVASMRPDAGKSTLLVGDANDPTATSFQRRGFPAEQFEPAPLFFKGERVPTGIRFTVRPTWLPFDHPTTKAKKPTMAEDKPRDHSPRGATQILPVRKAGSAERKPAQFATDTTNEPVRKSICLAGDTPPSSPQSSLLNAEETNQTSPIRIPQSRETFQNIYGMLFPQDMDPDPRPSQAKNDAGRKSKPAVKRRPPGETSGGGIYEKLFPDDTSEQLERQLQSRAQPEETKQKNLSPNEEDLVPPEETIFVSLRNEIRNWIPEEQRKQITAPAPGEPGSHSTVLILSGLSNSLVDTDFYRILPEARHIEGWAGGLVKVVQARDALSHEPVGRYFLMFHSKPAADAYKAEILRLHSLSKRLLHSSMGKGPLADAPTNPQPFLTDAEKAAVRSFTLCPPTAPLLINVHMWNSNLVREIAQNTNIADVVQALRPDVATPSKVLVTVNTIPGTKAGAGGGLTTDELWLTLRDDGRERGAPWVLSNLKNGIMPVKLRSTSRHGKIDFRSEAVQASLEGPIYDELDMLAEPPSTGEAEPFAVRKVTYDDWHNKKADKDDIWDDTFFSAPKTAIIGREERFNRFVVTFTQPAISRRFVRSWHKRAIWDAYEKRSVSIDAVALM